MLPRRQRVAERPQLCGSVEVVLWHVELRLDFHVEPPARLIISPEVRSLPDRLFTVSGGGCLRTLNFRFGALLLIRPLRSQAVLALVLLADEAREGERAAHGRARVRPKRLLCVHRGSEAQL